MVAIGCYSWDDRLLFTEVAQGQALPAAGSSLACGGRNFTADHLMPPPTATSRLRAQKGRSSREGVRPQLELRPFNNSVVFYVNLTTLHCHVCYNSPPPSWWEVVPAPSPSICSLSCPLKSQLPSLTGSERDTHISRSFTGICLSTKRLGRGHKRSQEVCLLQWSPHDLLAFSDAILVAPGRDL